MPVSVSYPGLYVEELPSSARSITPAPTSITVFIGYGHPYQGRVANAPATDPLWGKAIQIFSFSDYETWFGGLFHSTIVPEALPYAVYQFFLNGGSNAYVVALEPRFVGAGGARSSVDPASDNLSGIKFTARQLTDSLHTIAISVRNLRPATGPATNNMADISITFGSMVEVYRNVITAGGTPANNTSPDFIANKLARSRLVKIAPAGGAATYPTTFTEGTVDLGDMPGASLGLDIYSAEDFTKAFARDSSLDKVEIFNLLVIPGNDDPTVWSTALAFCEEKRAFYIMDPPRFSAADATFDDRGFTAIEDYIGTIPTLPPNGAFYFPYLQAGDPLSPQPLIQAPSGFVAGVYARTDRQRGVWKAPAGLETTIVNTRGVIEEGRMTDMRQGTVNDDGINVLRYMRGSGTVVWGARTNATSPALEQWRYVPVRRMALFIEQSLVRNLGWAVFEPNGEPLWTALRITVEAFMLSLYRQQAFFGTTPSAAFSVQCDDKTTTQQDIDQGIVNIVVGFRPLKPAEFVVIKIAQLAGQAP